MLQIHVCIVLSCPSDLAVPLSATTNSELTIRQRRINAELSAKLYLRSSHGWQNLVALKFPKAEKKGSRNLVLCAIYGRN